jgi:hypothetical protein
MSLKTKLESLMARSEEASEDEETEETSEEEEVEAAAEEELEEVAVSSRAKARSARSDELDDLETPAFIRRRPGDKGN